MQRTPNSGSPISQARSVSLNMFSSENLMPSGNFATRVSTSSFFMDLRSDAIDASFHCKFLWNSLHAHLRWER